MAVEKNFLSQSSVGEWIVGLAWEGWKKIRKNVVDLWGSARLSSAPRRNGRRASEAGPAGPLSPRRGGRGGLVFLREQGSLTSVSRRRGGEAPAEGGAAPHGAARSSGGGSAPRSFSGMETRRLVCAPRAATDSGRPGSGGRAGKAPAGPCRCEAVRAGCRQPDFWRGWAFSRKGGASRSKVRAGVNFYTESLILAQNERWRRV